MRVSANAIGQRALDLLGRVQRTQNGDRFDGRQGECRRHIGRNASEANHFDVQLFISRFDRLGVVRLTNHDRPIYSDNDRRPAQVCLTMPCRGTALQKNPRLNPGSFRRTKILKPSTRPSV